MATDRQIESARINGAKSQGPITPEGKAQSAQNARKHGLCSTILLATESHEQLETLVDRLSNRFPSDDILDELLLQEMAVAKWRQLRAWNMEMALMNDQLQRQQAALAQEYTEIDHITRTSLAFDSLSSKATTIRNLALYEARHRHAYHKAEEKLKRNQKERANLTNEPDSDDSK